MDLPKFIDCLREPKPTESRYSHNDEIDVKQLIKTALQVEDDSR